MKKSLYNYLTYIDYKWVLYNSFTDGLLILDEKVKDIYKKDVKSIKDLHPEFYTYLGRNGFLVSANEIEYQKCIKRWDKDDNDESCFSLTINPTLDCNMRCWYCYENHEHHRRMTNEVMLSIQNLISSKMQDEKLRSFNLSFFGGEPLLCFENIIKPIIEFTIKASRENRIEVTLCFTTNGYLLRESVVEFLSSTGCQINFQITLDGNEDFHNRIRITNEKNAVTIRS